MQNANLTGKSRTLKNTNNLFSYIKMVKEILTFGNIEIEKKKKKFATIRPIFLEDLDIEKISVSNKISFGEKTIRTLLVACIMVVKLNH